MDNEKRAALWKPHKQEVLTALLKGGLGLIPGVGSMLAETVGVFIPDKRMERIEQMLVMFAEKVYGADPDRLQARLASNEFQDILSDGCIAAAKAIRGDRLNRIAALLKNAATDKDEDYLTPKRLLALFDSLSDAEIIILLNVVGMVGKGEHFYQLLDKHGESKVREADAYRLDLYDSYADRLIQLGLLRAGNLNNAISRTYGEERMILVKPMFYVITPLGWNMLCHLDFNEDFPIDPETCVEPDQTP